MSTNTKERGRASVIMMRGHGEQRLRQAMMQGLVREEIAADVEELLQQVDDARREHEQLDRNYRGAVQRVGEYERIYFDAVGASRGKKPGTKERGAEGKGKSCRHYLSHRVGQHDHQHGANFRLMHPEGESPP